MAGLFNADTQLEALLERQRQQNVAQQEQFGQLFGAAAGNRRQAAVNTVGAQIGAAFGQGLAGGILGEPENIQQARQAVTDEEAVQEQLGRINWDDPEDLRKAGQLLFKVSPEAGLKLSQQAVNLAKEQKTIQAQQEAKDKYVNLISATNPEEALALRAGESTIEQVQDRLLKKQEFASKAPKIVSVTDGDEVVNLKWDSAAGRYEEISRGEKFSPAATTNNTFNLPSGDLQEFKFLRTNYEDAVGPIKSDLREYSDIQTALDQGTGVASEKVTSGLAKLFGAKSNSIKEVTRFENTGELPTRIASRLVRFFEGTPSAAEEGDIRALLDVYAKDRQGQFKQIKSRAIKDAETRNVSPTLIIGYDPDFLTTPPSSASAAPPPSGNASGTSDPLGIR